MTPDIDYVMFTLLTYGSSRRTWRPCGVYERAADRGVPGGEGSGINS